MSLLDEICQILKRASQPMHFSDIARRLTSTPNTSDLPTYVDAFICRHIREDPKNSRIRRVEPGVFELVRMPTLSEEMSERRREVRHLLPRLSKGKSRSYLRAAILVLNESNTTVMPASAIARRAVELGLITRPDGDLDAMMRVAIKKHIDGPYRTHRKTHQCDPRCIVARGDGCYYLSKTGRERARQHELEQAGGAQSQTKHSTLPTEPEKPKQPTADNPSSPPPSSHSVADTAYRVLQMASGGAPMHIQDIAKHARDRGWIKRREPVSGLTVAIYKEYSGRSKIENRFVLVGNNHVGLRE